MIVDRDVESNQNEKLSNNLTLIQDEIILPGGISGTYDYAKQGTGMGVIVIPMTVGRSMALVRKQRHPLVTSLWEFPRAGTPEISAAEAERYLHEETGLRATCRLVANITPESSSLKMNYGVYEAFVQDDPVTGGLPSLAFNGQSEQRWFSEEELAAQIKNSVLIDALTLAALAIKSLDEDMI